MKETISIKGMHCGSCVKNIENEVVSMEGVKKIKVDLAKSKAFVEFDNKVIGIDRIKKKIALMGYSVDGKKSKGVAQGIMYGLIPHIGCIAFIVGSVLGVTVLTQFFTPLLMNPYFFHILIAISIGFATLSSALYLRKNGILSLDGIRCKWKYLTTMYGSTIGINLVLFMLIFPLLANVSLAAPTGLLIAEVDSSYLSMEVDIPCPGHAPLITQELKTIDGVGDVHFSFPNLFDVNYDSSKTTKQQILSLDVFETYKARVVSEDVKEIQTNSNPSYNSGCGCGGSTCGGVGSCCGA
ncbi:MAG: heavy-metal-associated domain-containing protein [Candidatus Aenigmatarchaeota archaeon]